MTLEEHLKKIDSYKKAAWRRKYQRKHFGISDGDVLSFRDLLVLVDKIAHFKNGK